MTASESETMHPHMLPTSTHTHTHLHGLLKVAELKNSFVQGQRCVCLSQSSGKHWLFEHWLLLFNMQNSKMKEQRQLRRLHFSIMMSGLCIMCEWLEKRPQVTLINMWWFQCRCLRGVASSLSSWSNECPVAGQEEVWAQYLNQHKPLIYSFFLPSFFPRDKQQQQNSEQISEDVIRQESLLIIQICKCSLRNVQCWGLLTRCQR